MGCGASSATGGTRAHAYAHEEITVAVNHGDAGFTMGEDLSVTHVKPNGRCDEAGVTSGLFVVQFQNKPLAPDTTRAALRQMITVAERPWKFSFAPYFPASGAVAMRVAIGCRTYAIENGRLLCELGEMEQVKQVAHWLASSARSAAAVTGLVVRKKRQGEPSLADKVMGQLLGSLRNIPLTTLDVTDCGAKPMRKLTTVLKDACEFNASIEHLALSSNPIGDKVMHMLLDALKDLPLISLDISKTNCGVSIASKLAELLSEDTKFKAMTSINCLNNPLGDGVQDIIQVFAETPRLRTLCGLKEGVQRVEWTDSDKGPADVALLTAELRARRAASAVTSLKLSGANFGNVFNVGSAYFRVDDGVQVAFRNSPDINDRRRDGADGGSLQTAIDQTNGWIQIAQNKWLPKQWLKQIDTSTPCVFQVMCETLKASKVTEVDFSSCELGSTAMSIVSDYVREATAVLTSINCLKNPIGQDGLATLVAAVKDSSVRSICGLTEGQTVADFSDMALTPFDCQIVSAEFELRGVITATTSLNMSGANFGDMTENFEATLVADGVVVECRLGETHSKEKFEYRGRIATTVPITAESSLNNTSDLDKVVALSHRGGCSFMKKLDRVRTAGAVALIVVNTDDHGLITPHAEDSMIPVIAVRSCDGQLLEQAAEIVLVIEPKPCTLRLLCEALKTSHVTDVDVSSCGLGWPAMDIWSNCLPELKSLTSLDLSMNPLKNRFQNDTDATALGAVLSASSLKCLIIGPKRTRLHMNQLEVTELNLGRQNLTPAQATLVGASLLTLPAIARLNLSGNMITGSDLGGWEKKFDKEVEDFLPFLEALLHLKNPIELDLSNCCLGEHGVAYVGAVLELGGRLNSLTIDSTGGNGSPRTYTLTAGEDNINLRNKNLGPADVHLLAFWLATPASKAVVRLDLSENMITGSRNEARCYEPPYWICDPQPNGLVELCKALSGLQKRISLDLSMCGLATTAGKVLTEAMSSGDLDLISMNGRGNYFEKRDLVTLVTAVRSATSDAVRLYLRSAQLLAFSGVLHGRIGTDCGIRCEDLSEDVLRNVAEIVHGLRGHELLCEQLHAKVSPHQLWCQPVRGLSVDDQQKRVGDRSYEYHWMREGNTSHRQSERNAVSLAGVAGMVASIGVAAVFGADIDFN